MRDVALRNPEQLVARLDLEAARRLLLVDSPASLRELLRVARSPENLPDTVQADSIRSAKGTFDAILAWREDRVGSRAVFDAMLKRVDPQGVLWVVTALKKVTGPETPGARRLEKSDLEKAFAPGQFRVDREVRVSPWHVAYRFSRANDASELPPPSAD